METNPGNFSFSSLGKSQSTCMETNPNGSHGKSQSELQKPPTTSPVSHQPQPLSNNCLPNEDPYWKKFAVGYRFCPKDGELIVHYLKKKLLNRPLPPNKIVEANIYQHNPEQLAAIYKAYKDDNAYYFFTPRERKYPKGDRPSRTAGCGYWRATGSEKPVMDSQGVRVGSRNALVFYRGKAPRGAKTDWIMHEFIVDNPPPTIRTCDNDMTLDTCVLCKIYSKPGKSRSCKVRKAEVLEEDHHDLDPSGDDNQTDHQNESTFGSTMSDIPSGHIMLDVSNNHNHQASSNEMNNKNMVMVESESLPQFDPSSYLNSKNYEVGITMEGIDESMLTMEGIDELSCSPFHL